MAKCDIQIADVKNHVCLWFKALRHPTLLFYDCCLWERRFLNIGSRYNDVKQCDNNEVDASHIDPSPFLP
ncbi:Hypothetical protein ABZS17G119_02788 [Kosakonia cowanii]